MLRRVTFTMLLGLLVAVGCSEDDNPAQPPPPPAVKTTHVNAIKDNTLYEDTAGTWSNGAGNYLFVGMTNPAGGSGEPAEARRAVLNFEVSTGGIPAGATIDSVFLTMAASKAPTVAPMTITLHRVLADWGEGASVALGEEGGGASSAGGDATWIHTFFDTTMWTNPGGDYVPVASASQTVTVSGNGTTFTYYTWGSTPQMVADVQMWQDTPSSDFGWILIGEEAPSQTNARRFGSRTGPTFQVPDLCIYYH